MPSYNIMLIYHFCQRCARIRDQGNCIALREDVGVVQPLQRRLAVVPAFISYLRRLSLIRRITASAANKERSGRHRTSSLDRCDVFLARIIHE